MAPDQGFCSATTDPAGSVPTMKVTRSQCRRSHLLATGCHAPQGPCRQESWRAPPWGLMGSGERSLSLWSCQGSQEQSQEKGTQGECGRPGNGLQGDCTPSTPSTPFPGHRATGTHVPHPSHPVLAQQGGLAWRGEALRWSWQAGLIGRKPAVESPGLVADEDSPALGDRRLRGARFLHLCASDALNQVLLSFPQG